MKTVTVDVPESLLEAAGSEVDPKRMMLEGAIAKLVEWDGSRRLTLH